MAIILCNNRLPSNFYEKKRGINNKISAMLLLLIHQIEHTKVIGHMGELHGWTLITWMKLTTRATNGWNWWHNWAIWYDMDFFKDVYFHVIYHVDENNESHLKNSHIDEVDNIDELPNYGGFFFFFSFLFNFVISRIWWISHKIIKIKDFLSGFKDFHLVLVNCQVVWKCFSKYHCVQGKTIMKEKEHEKMKFRRLSCQFFQYFNV
jgi:hypothetical protein